VQKLLAAMEPVFEYFVESKLLKAKK